MRIRKPNYLDYTTAAIEWIEPQAVGGYWETRAAKEAVDALFSRELETGGKEYRKLPASKRIVLRCDGISISAEWEDDV